MGIQAGGVAINWGDMMGRKFLLSTVALSTVIAAVACGEAGGRSEPVRNHQTSAASTGALADPPTEGGPVATRLLVSKEDGDAKFEALMSGRLGVDDRGCVTLGGDALVAPKGSAIGDDGRTVSIKGVGTFRLGDGLPPVGGGHEEYADWSQVPAEQRACSGTDFAVLTP